MLINSYKSCIFVELCVCLCLTSHQQLRSFGDEVTAYSLILQTDEAGDLDRQPLVYKASGFYTAPQRLFFVELYGDKKSMVDFYIQNT